MRCVEESKSTIRSGAVNDLKEVDAYYLPLNLLIFVLFVNDKIDDSEKLHKNGQLGQKSCSGSCGNEDAYQLPHNLLQCFLWSTEITRKVVNGGRRPSELFEGFIECITLQNGTVIAGSMKGKNPYSLHFSHLF